MADNHFTNKAIEFHGFPGFLEKHLGQISKAWTKDKDGKELDCHILQWNNQPEEACLTFVTNGLIGNNFNLYDGNLIQEELMVCCTDTSYHRSLVNHLLSVTDLLKKQQRALLPGHVVGPYPAPIENTDKKGFFVAPPIYHPAEVALFTESDPTTYLIWLVPITENEAEFIFSHGHVAFTNLLEEQGPDVLDLNRPEMMLTPPQ